MITDVNEDKEVTEYLQDKPCIVRDERNRVIEMRYGNQNLYESVEMFQNLNKITQAEFLNFMKLEVLHDFKDKINKLSEMDKRHLAKYLKSFVLTSEYKGYVATSNIAEVYENLSIEDKQDVYRYTKSIILNEYDNLRAMNSHIHEIPEWFQSMLAKINISTNK